MLKQKVKKNKVLGILKSDYIDSIFTIYLNGKINEKSMESTINIDFPVILLHGFWGPQKNIEFALETLKSLKDNNYKFHLIISGGINVHFPKYELYPKFEASLVSEEPWLIITVLANTDERMGIKSPSKFIKLLLPKIVGP